MSHKLGCIFFNQKPHLVALWRGVGATAASASSREKKEPIAPPLAGGLSVLLGSFTSVWWLQKVWKPKPPPGGRRPPPEGGAHLGHVFRGQL